MHRLLLVSALLTFAMAPAAAQSLLKVSASQRQALGIVVGDPQVAEHVPLDGLAATVRVPLHESAVVTTLFAGTTVAILAREGEMVHRGQVLARIQSRDAMSLGAELSAARGELDLARAQAERDQALLDEGIIPASRAHAALARRDAATAHLRELQAARSVAPQAVGAAPGTYELRAPLDGRVIERSLRLGEPVDALATAFVVAKPGHVMLEIQVPARYATQMRLGLPVRAADGSTGVLTEVGASMHQASQTVLIRASMQSETLLPGQQTRATLLLPTPGEAWLLPSGAVAEHDGQRVVFVERSGGFEPLTVSLLAQTGDGHSVVSGPLTTSDRVVVSAAGTLKAMLIGDE